MQLKLPVKLKDKIPAFIQGMFNYSVCIIEFKWIIWYHNSRRQFLKKSLYCKKNEVNFDDHIFPKIQRPFGR